MPRPLLITDCDEVLLHMVVPFRQWLAEIHDVEFDFRVRGFVGALRSTRDGSQIPQEQVWDLLRGFFETEMHRQHPAPGAVEALARIGEHADVAVLTNLLDHHRDARAEQLGKHGIICPVNTNQGPKGGAIRRLMDEFQPSVAVFVDDLHQHLESAAEHVPGIWRLHMVCEPDIAPHVDCAFELGHAHARIDGWDEAADWIIKRFEEGKAAPSLDLEKQV
jgi:hypothetical protein